MIARLKDRQVRGKRQGDKSFCFVPGGLYLFSGGQAIPLQYPSVLANSPSYQLPKDWFQNLINNQQP
jgi:hypothetical protein